MVEVQVVGTILIALSGIGGFILGFRSGKKFGYTDAVRDVIETGEFKTVEEIFK